jgi:hypothetical protein
MVNLRDNIAAVYHASFTRLTLSPSSFILASAKMARFALISNLTIENS